MDEESTARIDVDQAILLDRYRSFIDQLTNEDYNAHQPGHSDLQRVAAMLTLAWAYRSTFGQSRVVSVLTDEALMEPNL